LVVKPKRKKKGKFASPARPEKRKKLPCPLSKGRKVVGQKVAGCDRKEESPACAERGKGFLHPGEGEAACAEQKSLPKWEIKEKVMSSGKKSGVIRAAVGEIKGERKKCAHQKDRALHPLQKLQKEKGTKQRKGKRVYMNNSRQKGKKIRKLIVQKEKK